MTLGKSQINGKRGGGDEIEMALNIKVENVSKPLAHFVFVWKGATDDERR